MKNQLKRSRKSAGLTQKEAAIKIGVGQSAISMWETGNSIPRTELLPKIADVYGCSVSALFEADEKPA